MDALSTPPVLTTLEEVTPPGWTTPRFIGAEHGSEVSFFVSRNEPGSGPDLHTHPYTETFVILEGNVRFTVGSQVVDATAGEILVVPSQAPHGFTCLGPDRMLSVNVHAAARMQQTDLPSRRRDDGSYELV